MSNPSQPDWSSRTLNISQTAHRNHEELFPKHQSILKGTDPELIEIFDNFAFDEVLAQSKFDTKTRMMMILASLIANQAVSEYKVMAGAALNVGTTLIYPLLAVRKRRAPLWIRPAASTYGLRRRKNFSRASGEASRKWFVTPGSSVQFV